jgi:hypothetical protein
MTVDGETVSVDHTAVAKEQSKETTFGGSQSMTVKRDIEPLLSKVVGGASAAYSLRDLNDVLGNSNKVVRVRRSSDNAEKDFTASEMGAALEDWVNTDVTIYQSDFSSSPNGWSGSTASPVGNQDGVSDGTTSKDNVLKLTKAQDAQAYISRNQGVIAGLTYTVSGSLYAPSSNTGVDGILIKDGVAGSSLSDYPSGYLTSNGVWTDFSFSYTATVSGSQRINMGISSLGSNPNGSSAGSAGDVVYISDLQFVETTSNGHVETWYDQSGSGNDATQTVAASQPKIVDAGSLVSGGIDFDGTDDFLEINNSDLCNISELSLFTVLTGIKPTSRDIAVSAGSVVPASTAYGGWVLGFDQAAGARLLTQALGSSAISTANKNFSPGEHLVTSILNVPNGTTSVDSVEGTTNTSMIEPYNNNIGRRKLRIGCQYTFQVDRHYSAPIKEVIIYSSDQSANRAAIETNINNHYDIY